MVVRNQVKSLQSISYESLENLSSYLCLHVANTILTNNSKTLYTNPEQIQHMVQSYVERLSEYLWSYVVPSTQDNVFHHFLEGIISSVEIMKVCFRISLNVTLSFMQLKAKWKLNTKMPEFTLQVWAMTKISEVLHQKQLKYLDLESVPKMMRGQMLRNLRRFPNLRKLVFGSSTGDMTVHITKVWLTR